MDFGGSGGRCWLLNFFVVPDESQKPQALVWTDGREYEIDRLTDGRQAT